MDIRIIGLGNSILTDDGVGIYAVREVSRRLAEAGIVDAVDIVESEVAGFALMELMTGWKRVILVDSIQFDDVVPGTVIKIQPDDLRTSLRIRSVHEIDLPTLVAFGRKLGIPMPETITIIGIQAEDALTLGETLTEAAQRGMMAAVDLILQEVAGTN